MRSHPMCTFAGVHAGCSSKRSIVSNRRCKSSCGAQASIVKADVYWHKALAKGLCGALRRDESGAECASHLR